VSFCGSKTIKAITLIIIMVMAMGEKTTIQVSKKLRDKLKELGKKGETYEEIIRRLVEHYEKGKK